VLLLLRLMLVLVLVLVDQLGLHLAQLAPMAT
jgi:hypothetical protein